MTVRRCVAALVLATVAAACAGAGVAAVVLAAGQSYLTSVGSPPAAPAWICALLLAGLGGAVLPVVLHLLSRARYRRIDFGAMMFLMPALASRSRRWYSV